MRFSITATAVARRTTVDTQVLGCPIPAGTDLIMNLRVFRFDSGVAEERRTASSRAAHSKRLRHWDSATRDLDAFEPRRWLVRDDSGKELFDVSVLPSIGFAGGLRGCFGKRLAMLELKVMMVLLVLNFEFLPLPEELASMEGIEKVFRRPKMCHVRLRAL